MRKAVFPGTFDPFTIGHQSIVTRSLELFDEIVVAIGVNSSKSAMFTLDQRTEWIEKVFNGNNKIKVKHFSGLTVDFCKSINAKYILRGLRSSADFNYERAIAQMNHSMKNEIETVFIMSLPEHSAISSTILRDIIRNNGKVDDYVPAQIKINV